MQQRLSVGVAVLLLVGACSTTAPTSPGPSAGPQSSGSSATAPAGTGSGATPGGQSPGPGSTTEPGPDLTPAPLGTPEPEAPPEPLPEAEDLTAGEIYVNLPLEGFIGLRAAVALCKYLGIGIYGADGSVILPGSDTGPHDLFLFEDEVRQMPEMARASFLEPDLTFQDFHASLTSFGLEMSAQELLDHYTQVYNDFENSQTPFGQLIYRGLPFDTTQPMTRIDAWLLFLDGFVPPNGSNPGASRNSGLLAERGGSPGGGSAGGGLPTARWGLANIPIPHVITLPYTDSAADFPQVIAHLMLVAGQVRISLNPRTVRLHEGHGAPGQPQQYQATVTSPGAADWVSPTLGWLRPFRGFTGQLSGMDVTWTPSGPWMDHGSFSAAGSTPFTTPLGTGNAASTVFTPRQEAANGEGKLVSEGAVLFAKVPATPIIEQMYGAPAGSLKGLLGNATAETVTRAMLEKHDTHTLHISFIDDYDIGLDILPVGGPQLFGITNTGADQFVGDLVLQEDGSWKGVVTGTSNVDHHSAVFGSPCNTSWSGTQQVEVTITAEASSEGNARLRFKPVTPPQYTSPPTCPEVIPFDDGSPVKWLPYYDSDYRSVGWVVTLPGRPGGTWSKDYSDVPPPPQGSHFRRSTTLTVEYHEPN